MSCALEEARLFPVLLRILMLILLLLTLPLAERSHLQRRAVTLMDDPLLRYHALEQHVTFTLLVPLTARTDISCAASSAHTARRWC